MPRSFLTQYCKNKKFKMKLQSLGGNRFVCSVTWLPSISSLCWPLWICFCSWCEQTQVSGQEVELLCWDASFSCHFQIFQRLADLKLLHGPLGLLSPRWVAVCFTTLDGSQQAGHRCHMLYHVVPPSNHFKSLTANCSGWHVESVPCSCSSSRLC